MTAVAIVCTCGSDSGVTLRARLLTLGATCLYNRQPSGALAISLALELLSSGGMLSRATHQRVCCDAHMLTMLLSATSCGIK